MDGLVAHLSVKACENVYREACLLQPLLHLEMLPKSNVWPNSFRTSGPTDDNIAMYFFPANTRCGFESHLYIYIYTLFSSNFDLLLLFLYTSSCYRCERGFDDLVNLMIRDELAMRVFLSNAELLVFTSIELPLLYWSKPILYIGYIHACVLGLVD